MNCCLRLQQLFPIELSFIFVPQTLNFDNFLFQNGIKKLLPFCRISQLNYLLTSPESLLTEPMIMEVTQAASED